MSFFFTNLNLGYFFDIFQGLPMSKSHQQKVKDAHRYSILTVRSVDFSSGRIDKDSLADYYTKGKVNEEKYFLRESDYIISCKGKRRGLLLNGPMLGNSRLLVSQHFIIMRLKPGLEDKSPFFHHLADMFLEDIPYATSSGANNIKYTRVKDVEDYAINVGLDLEQEYKAFRKEWDAFERARGRFEQKEREFDDYLLELKNKLTLKS